MKVFFLSAIALAVVSGVPSVKREADPLLYAAGPVVHHAPLVYHAPNCTSVDETLTTKQCLPKVEEKCEDVEIQTQEIVFEETCVNVTVPVCNVVEVAEEEEEAAAEVVKREANPQQLVYGAALPYFVQAPQYKCEDQVQEQCVKAPVVKPTIQPVNVCKILTDVECKDVEHTVPKVTCVHQTHFF